MNRIDDLIAERCPGGVAFEALGTLVQRGLNIKWSDFGNDEFSYIDLTSVDRIAHSISATKIITRETAPSRAQQIVRAGDVIFGTTRPMLKRYCIIPSEFDGQIASTGYCVLRPDTDRLLTNFLFHLLGTADFYSYVEANERGASYPAIPDGIVKEFRIPVPPLGVQREIVRILDHFTELEAELEARRNQFDTYCERLLSGVHAAGGTYRLGDVLTTVIDHRGKTPKKLGGDWTAYGHRVISALNIKRGAVDNNDHHYISNSMYAKWMPTPLEVGDVLLTSEAPLGSLAYIDAPVDWAVGQRIFVLRPNPAYLHGRYLFHLLRSGAPRKELMARSTGSTVSGIRQAELVKVQASLPPIESQIEIAGTLDKFDALVNDLSIGLPAELAARRKQYEYYRDRLLTFEELAA